MSAREFVTVDGNEAAAEIAHQLNEVVAIYPITPASPMGEWADAWSAAGRTNLFGSTPRVVEMQSEAGAAGAVHGALQAGALTTTFTASQGLLLMIPNMYKIAGELTPAVFHVAARTVATHALSIFGDHSDVMAVRQCGWGMLAAGSVQEAHDFACVAQLAALKSRVPFVHFFDGFRTSHEINKIRPLTADDLQALIDHDDIHAHRARALSPDHPVLRGSAQNPDVFFQAREAVNTYYQAVPRIVTAAFRAFAERTGRAYELYQYHGAADAERVLVMMGSGAGAAAEAVDALRERGEKVGLVQVRLFRPWDAEAFSRVLPSTCRQLAVLDRTKEPGSAGEPLYQDVVTSLAETCAAGSRPLPRILGGRYGLSSKEFTPAMAIAVFAALRSAETPNHFTVGINDDVTHLSLPWNEDGFSEPDDVRRAVFFGLGSDGTVGANKNTVKIIGENTPLHVQGYFVYDSKKAGAITVSHLRISPRPIQSTYLIREADFVGCHQSQFLDRIDLLKLAKPGATFLLNTTAGPEQVWDTLPREIQQALVDKQLRFYVVDAYRVAREAGLGGRINTVMQTCYFALADILPREEAIAEIKDSIRKSYGKRGESVLQKNFAAVDGAVAAMHSVEVPAEVSSARHRLPPVAEDAPDFVRRVTGMMIAGKGDLLPVSALPVDGTFPTATAQYEKRSIAQAIPIWEPEICIQCGLCALDCPHAAIRVKAFPPEDAALAPETFRTLPWSGKDHAGHRMTIQVAPDDCTGCGVCVDVCPAHSKEAVRVKAINMAPKDQHLLAERQNFEFFRDIPEIDRTQVKLQTVKGTQLLQPLFEFSGACGGCGETPYLKLLTQLFGDRIVIANATGCSSIYGGNLPTTPWSTNAEGRGPAWANSLFEDNAEFGLGMRLALDHKHQYARDLLKQLAEPVGQPLVDALLADITSDESQVVRRREQIAELKQRLEGNEQPEARILYAMAEELLPRDVWIVGGDGWAYDIGSAGLDHVLSSGQNVNVLVLDTAVYSNTGGQSSKATPRGAIAKFAAAGKPGRKKDLGMVAVAYNNAYVAQIALGANPAQTLRAFQEAQSYPGPSLLLAYSHCIAHGIEMSTSMTHQKDAVNSGYWPLYRYDPRNAHDHGRPFHLDSRQPSIPFREFAMKEARFAMLARANPQRAQELFALAQQDIDDTWSLYAQMAGVERELVTPQAP